jgi:hypothetical protein
MGPLAGKSAMRSAGKATTKTVETPTTRSAVKLKTALGVNGGEGGDQIDVKLRDELGCEAGNDVEGKDYVEIDREVVEHIVAMLSATCSREWRVRCRTGGCDFVLNES